jgi:hypothetical protein
MQQTYDFKNIEIVTNLQDIYELLTLSVEKPRSLSLCLDAPIWVDICPELSSVLVLVDGCTTPSWPLIRMVSSSFGDHGGTPEKGLPFLFLW